MQHARHGSAAEQRREPAEDPGHVNSKAREQSEKEEDAVGPVQKARVGAMAKEFSHIDDGQADSIDEMIGAARDAICRSRHSVFLSRLAAVDLAHRRLRLYAPRSL